MTDKYTISLPVFDINLGSSGIREINVGSTIDERKALEQFARYFKNEMNYTGVQYEAENHSNNCIGFLFYTNATDIVTEEHETMPSRCYGGCTFSKIGKNWVLCWIWFHPFFRNRNHLSSLWKHFHSEFGDFDIESPVSLSMESFLKKQSSTHHFVKIPSY